MLPILLLRDPDHPSPVVKAALESAVGASNLEEAAPTRDSFPAVLDRLRSGEAAGAYVLGKLRVDAAQAASRYFTVSDSLGVANAIKGPKDVYGTNTEGDGFLMPIKDVEPATALILGAGTGARMAATALLKAGWRVKVWNRTMTRSRGMGIALQRAGKVELVPEPEPGRCRLVVNATLLGARPGETPPVVWERASPHTIAYDLVWRERVPTDFLRAASRRGFATVDGRESIIGATALALAWIQGQMPDLEKMRAAVFEAV